MKELGTLKRVDLREIWPKEAADFTPWLAENLQALAEVLGMDLELQGREAPVGALSTDILARDLGRDRLVVIENQLEATDHDHLGKLLTYAAGHDASTVVWLASEIRDEHRQALDWLNQRTDTNTEFFGVVVEVLRIDDSRPAYNFRLVAFPNQWRKSNVSVPGAQPSERAEAYRAFFQGLIDDLRERHKFTGARVAQPQNWYSFSSGFAGITYGAVFRAKGQFGVEVYIDRGEREANKSLFDALAIEKPSLEAQFQEPIAWERLDDRRASRITVNRPGNIEDDPQTIEEIKQWAIDRLLRFKAVFGPRIGELLRVGQ